MSDLLSFAVSAHGGLEGWNTFQAIEARMSVGGGIFAAKRNPGLQNDVAYKIQTREERGAINRFSAPDRRVNFVPSRLTLETLGGELIEARDNLRSAFAGQTEESPWDTIYSTSLGCSVCLAQYLETTESLIRHYRRFRGASRAKH